MSKRWLNVDIELLEAYIRDDDVASIEQLVEEHEGDFSRLPRARRSDLWDVCQESLAIEAATYFFEQTYLFEVEDYNNPKLRRTSYSVGPVVRPVTLDSFRLLGVSRSDLFGRYAAKHDWKTVREQGVSEERHAVDFKTLERLKAFIRCVIDHGRKFDEDDILLAPAMTKSRYLNLSQ